MEEIIRSGTYDRLHILTHAFWYHKADESITETVSAFIRCRKCGTLWTDAGKYHRLGEHCDEGSVFMKIKEILDFLQTAGSRFLLQVTGEGSGPISSLSHYREGSFTWTKAGEHPAGNGSDGSGSGIRCGGCRWR